MIEIIPFGCQAPLAFDTDQILPKENLLNISHQSLPFDARDAREGVEGAFSTLAKDFDDLDFCVCQTPSIVAKN